MYFPFLEPGFVAVSVLVGHHSRRGITQKYATCFVTLSDLFSPFHVVSILYLPTRGRERTGHPSSLKTFMVIALHSGVPYHPKIKPEICDRCKRRTIAEDPIVYHRPASRHQDGEVLFCSSTGKANRAIEQCSTIKT